MVFSTPVFLFYFLALTLLVYYVVPRKLRNVVLLVSSLFFYYWGERVYVTIMLVSTAVDFTHGMLVEKCQAKGNDKGARLAVASSIFFATTIPPARMSMPELPSLFCFLLCGGFIRMPGER